MQRMCEQNLELHVNKSKAIGELEPGSHQFWPVLYPTNLRLTRPSICMIAIPLIFYYSGMTQFAFLVQGMCNLHTLIKSTISICQSQSSMNVTGTSSIET